ncbi:MAG TPA: SPOR domain-containing protein [Leucothrix sp.]|nr:SPOR domain-containing protein [Leucothrix sp.]
MRNLILLLLFLNTFYFVWTVIFNDKYIAPPRTVDGIPALVLLPSDKTKSNVKDNTNCFALGPFTTKKTAQLISNQINNAGLSSAIAPQQTMETLNFLVYLQALASKKEAQAVVKKLSENEVKDHTIIESGPYKNAIALGLFSDLDKARRHSEYIRFMGFDAKYTEQRKPKEVYWIKYDESFGSSPPVMQWVEKVDPRASVLRLDSACDFN